MSKKISEKVDTGTEAEKFVDDYLPDEAKPIFDKAEQDIETIKRAAAAGIKEFKINKSDLRKIIREELKKAISSAL